MKKLPVLSTLLAASLAFVSPAARAADAPKPLKVLLLTGGCCHDYKKQKDILKAGLEARANIVIDQIHSDDASTKPRLPIYGNPDYAKGYDLVIHDECSADFGDLGEVADKRAIELQIRLNAATQKLNEAKSVKPGTDAKEVEQAQDAVKKAQGEVDSLTKARNGIVVEDVLKPHMDGIPGVNLHCAMHCYRFGDFGKPVAAGADNSHWYEYLGLQSTGHGPQEPIEVTYTDKESPITKGMADWTTIKEEHYNNIQVFPTAHVIARGKQTTHSKKKQADGTETVEDKVNEAVNAWTNTYNGKTRVFSTTIGHNNETVSDAKYLDLVTRGVLWATNHINPDGTPAKGYGPGGK